MARDFTREEFCALVWSKPMTYLAKEFGLSDVALHKVCRKHAIPTPPAGWWAKKAAGKRVAITPLPPSPDPGTGRITIAGAELRDEPAPLTLARENARVLLSSPAGEPAIAPHPIVERTLARLRKARPSSENGLVSASGPGLVAVAIAPASIDRLEIALNAIFAAFRAVGGDIVRGETAAMLACDSERIAFTIRESLKREPHVLTKKEEAEQKASCGNHFTPYGAVELGFVVDLIADTALSALLKPPEQSKHTIWLAPDARIAEAGGQWSAALQTEYPDALEGGRQLVRAWPQSSRKACGAQRSVAAASTSAPVCLLITTCHKSRRRPRKNSTLASPVSSTLVMECAAAMPHLEMSPTNRLKYRCAFTASRRHTSLRSSEISVAICLPGWPAAAMLVIERQQRTESADGS
ncbi:hypothetical protein [Erythrobacter sp. SG61-1L]|uniref:hypothetical protein n=1 Tax=Erythrobacter sp. SG61-1L TaxID=1603897 RepID=UPI0006C90171|nr:hypothetical protein [Erythrobacter sp. SG61-1L]